ncbi:hypothetical protein GLAREA_09149 [Glarea lozoyensis ATCC 20868]|uniref:Uncharacterized protein n=1 Tax=Glarea lozoyensis (strain ATCC 20868 / MF5171) TaxID=1116229 RepID=S3DYG9_GLAL2|nr:uncharacterized protein GLAREA_09149 [Glarea lozoyensis ATCC 20868]EPE36986.1 hypothetical protein GLAREA_09149 [Glarea lozoyensis ATCC 20868]
MQCTAWAQRRVQKVIRSAASLAEGDPSGWPWMHLGSCEAPAGGPSAVGTLVFWGDGPAFSDVSSRVFGKSKPTLEVPTPRKRAGAAAGGRWEMGAGSAGY